MQNLKRGSRNHKRQSHISYITAQWYLIPRHKNRQRDKY